MEQTIKLTGAVIVDLTDRPNGDTDVEVEIDLLAKNRSGDVVEREPVLRLAEEDITVSKVSQDVGGVQVSRVTRTYQQPIEELLKSTKVEIERVSIDQPVNEVPPVRQEGDVVIVPVVEEVLSVERHLILKEEVHIRRTEQTNKFEDEVTLHRQEAEVSRLAPERPSVAAEPELN